MNIQLERELRKHMASNGIYFDPAEHTFITDNNFHEQWAYSNGKSVKVWYTITPNPFDTKEESMMCSYGLADDSEQYTFLSHPQESFKNTQPK